MLWVVRGKAIGVLGPAFKANTDDVRFSSAIGIARELEVQGAGVRAYRPVAMDRAEQELTQTTFCSSPYQVAEGADCLVALTEWPQVQSLDFEQIKQLMVNPILLDGRNLFDARRMRGVGVEYDSVGRP